MSEEQEQARREEAEARDRLHEVEAEAGETLEEAEELEESASEPPRQDEAES
jgi:hypothetical protein